MDELLAARLLSQNMLALRQSRGITQTQLAAVSGVPRSTITHMESGAGNPSLSNIMRVAAALEVQVQELLSPPLVVAQYYARADVPVKRKGDCDITDILPGGVKNCAVEKFEMPAQGGFVGVPHQRGTREYFYVLAGKIQVAVQDQLFVLEAGEALVFAGDERHAYKNLLKTRAAAISVLIS